MKNRLEPPRRAPAEPRLFDLADGGLISLKFASGYRIACRCGSLSISVPGARGQQGQDIELTHGKCLSIENCGLILIEAAGNARLALIAPQPARSASFFGRGAIVKVIGKATAMKPAASF